MRHALVVGGTRGIGAGVARALLAKGWTITATGVSAEEVAAAPKHDGFTAKVMDVTDPHSVAAVFKDLQTLHGLVNCAGILARGAEYEMGVFEKVIAVNLTGTMRTCLAAEKLLAQNGGAIVNTASMWSFFGGPLVPAYSASKGGVVQLTKALAVRWAGAGIRVNAIAPGWIETEMTAPVRADPTRNDPVMARTPIGRWGQPDEVGQTAAFLLSQDASYITGAVYTVDGGYSAV